MRTKSNLIIKVIDSDEMINIMADDGYNPCRIPLTLEDAEGLRKELDRVIERRKEWMKKH